MRTTVDKVDVKTFTYPCLRKSSDSGVVVLFTEQKRGTVVHVGNSNYSLGHHAIDWKPATGMPWEHCSSVLLENL